MNVTLKPAEETGLPELLVSPELEQGIHIYEKFGFRRVGHTHQWGENFWMYSLTL